MRPGISIGAAGRWGGGRDRSHPAVILLHDHGLGLGRRTVREFENSIDRNGETSERGGPETPGADDAQGLLLPGFIGGTEDGDVRWHAISTYLELKAEGLIARSVGISREPAGDEFGARGVLGEREIQAGELVGVILRIVPDLEVEVHLDVGRHGNGVAIFGAGPEDPGLHGFHGFFVEAETGRLGYFDVVRFAVFADDDV